MLVAQVTVRVTSLPLGKILALLVPLRLQVASQVEPSTVFILRSQLPVTAAPISGIPPKCSRTGKGHCLTSLPHLSG